MSPAAFNSPQLWSGAKDARSEEVSLPPIIAFVSRAQGLSVVDLLNFNHLANTDILLVPLFLVLPQNLQAVS